MERIAEYHVVSSLKRFATLRQSLIYSPNSFFILDVHTHTSKKYELWQCRNGPICNSTNNSHNYNMKKKISDPSLLYIIGFIIITALVGSNLTCAYFPISTRNDDDDEDAFLQPNSSSSSSSSSSSRGGSNCSSSGSGSGFVIGIGGSGEISHRNTQLLLLRWMIEL
uniref:Uncharacterized protein n=1 Tax=Glossina pallidipes TaxID=7398 RepID=A0A1B0ADU4_GLOPL